MTQLVRRLRLNWKQEKEKNRVERIESISGMLCENTTLFGFLLLSYSCVYPRYTTRRADVELSEPRSLTYLVWEVYIWWSFDVVSNVVL